MKQLNTTYATQAAPLQEVDLELHVKILKRLAQAAVNLEEFTIPLYMCSMYSLVGVHQITGKNAFYRGLWYPGAGITADPKKWAYDQSGYNLKDKIPMYEAGHLEHPDYDKTLFRPSNNAAFNLIYKVFIEEMLHLQLAANLAKILGANPIFTELTDRESYAWTCYKGSTIPYIVDLKDTKSYKDVKVELGALNENQINLFLAIEQSEEQAKEELGDKAKKYFPTIETVVEYYKESNGELPLMGSIGHLYQTLWDFLHLQFRKDNEITSLLQHILLTSKPYPQRDIFNKQTPGHPVAEYPGFDVTLFGDKAEYLLKRIQGLINAITEQGEGRSVAQTDKKKTDLKSVKAEDQVSRNALKRNYKAYDDTGKRLDASPRVNVRGGFAYSNVDGSFNSTAADHDEVFSFIKNNLMKQEDFMTWDQWHAKGNVWSEDLIKAKDYSNNKYAKKGVLPKPYQIIDAMNRLKLGTTKTDHDPSSKESQKRAKANYEKICKVSIGAIWGIVHVLDKYWNSKASQQMLFPYPAMGGTGDRMSICWTIFGKVPDLTLGLKKDEKRNSNRINHSCQGFVAMDPEVNAIPGANDCAQVGIYHTCKGSNMCKAEGGCGFVHEVGGKGNCSNSAQFSDTLQEITNDKNGCSPVYSKTLYNPAGDNACGGQGGCAVPISASQLFPPPPHNAKEKPDVNVGQMQCFAYEKTKDGWHSKKIPYKSKDETESGDYLDYKGGDSVYNVAWKAFESVLLNRGITPSQLPENPDDNDFEHTSDIRMAFPPST